MINLSRIECVNLKIRMESTKSELMLVAQSALISGRKGGNIGILSGWRKLHDFENMIKKLDE